jgi:hypothetical protein
VRPGAFAKSKKGPAKVVLPGKIDERGLPVVDSAPTPSTAPPAAWTPTPALTAALARLLIALARRDREPSAPPAAAKGVAS